MQNRIFKTGLSIIALLMIAHATASAKQPAIGEVVINEFVAAPQSIQSSEWVELYNTTGTILDISGMYIDDIAGGGAPKQIPEGTFIAPNGYYSMEFNSFLNNSGDDCRLLGTDQSTVFDSYTYQSANYDMSWCRRPDGGDWSSVEWEPTPIASNMPEQSGIWTPGNLEIHVLNVGQGMAQLVIGPTGRTLLLDCAELNWNSDLTARFVAGEIRRITGGSHLNYVLASHLHLDHIGYVGYGGIWALFEEQGISADKLIDRDAGTWVDNGDGIPDYDNEIVWSNVGTLSGTLKRWVIYVTDPTSYAYQIREIAQLGSETQIDLGIAEGVTIKVVQVDGDGVMMENGMTSIAGDHSQEALPPSENDYSITIWLKWNKFDFVFGGDTAGKYDTSSSEYTYNDVETVVAQRINQKVEVVSVNHHGSEHSSNSTYVTPQVAVYNVGDNSYGHPAQRVLDIFYANDADQYLTAIGDLNRNYYDAGIVNGNITIVTDNGLNYTVNGNAYLAEDPILVRSPRVPVAILNLLLINKIR
jgi:beta-lactamase superfamily II metal-dependent hydrolase